MEPRDQRTAEDEGNVGVIGQLAKDIGHDTSHFSKLSLLAQLSYLKRLQNAHLSKHIRHHINSDNETAENLELEFELALA